MGDYLRSFAWCPREARFISTVDDARSYYAHKLVGERTIVVGGIGLQIVFNREEIHLFTEAMKAGEMCPPTHVVPRPGSSSEVRKFNLERAHMLDDVLRTLTSAAVIHKAKHGGGRMVYGPADPKARRQCVVVAPGNSGVWFVRTAYPVSGMDFAQARRYGRSARWPP